MPVKKKPAGPAESSELSLIRKLAEILNETGLTEIELHHKGARVRVAKNGVAQNVVHHTPVHHAVPVGESAVPHITVTPTTAALVTGTPLKSPMVGTAYLASSAETDPFVTVGASVKQGQTVLIIEAMKTMNQIVAPKAGKILQIIVENAQPVEFGEVLMVIE